VSRRCRFGLPIQGSLGVRRDDDAADVLEKILREEENALEEVTQASEEFDKRAIAGD